MFVYIDKDGKLRDCGTDQVLPHVELVVRPPWEASKAIEAIFADETDTPQVVRREE